MNFPSIVCTKDISMYSRSANKMYNENYLKVVQLWAIQKGRHLSKQVVSGGSFCGNHSPSDLEEAGGDLDQRYCLFCSETWFLALLAALWVNILRYFLFLLKSCRIGFCSNLNLWLTLVLLCMYGYVLVSTGVGVEGGSAFKNPSAWDSLELVKS